MDLFEELVLWHLSRSGRIFICPQYPIARGWSCPDFVALDYKHKIVAVVEVSAAAWPKGLLNKVIDRENQWLTKLKDQLQRVGIIDGSWTKFQVWLYIRNSAINKFRKKLAASEDVVIHTLEDVGFPWNWDWPSVKAQKEAEESPTNQTAS